MNPRSASDLYDPADRTDPAQLAGYDFVLLPDYRLELLADCRFDLAINIASMQEMRVDQVERYLDFLRSTCAGDFYSCNRDRQNRNDEMPGLFDLIRTRFDLTDVAPPKRLPPREKLKPGARHRASNAAPRPLSRSRLTRRCRSGS